MDPAGLVNSIAEAAFTIDFGRKGVATRGKAEDGRLSYERGIAEALSVFKEVAKSRLAVPADPRIIILAEYAFISQELQFCDQADKDTLGNAD